MDLKNDLGGTAKVVGMGEVGSRGGTCQAKWQQRACGGRKSWCLCGETAGTGLDPACQTEWLQKKEHLSQKMQRKSGRM